MSQLEDLKKISLQLNNQLPEFVKADHPTFVALLEAYYEFMEQSDGVIGRGRNFIETQDVDQSFSEFLDYFYNTFLPMIPKDVLADRTLLLKHAKKFYRAKGTEKSFALLFHLMFNAKISIRYPKNNILTASGGKWALEKSLRIVPDNISEFENMAGVRIVGQESNATAFVENIKTLNYFGNTIYELFVTGIVGNFIPSERFVATREDEDGNTLTFTGILDGTVTEILIIDPGTGYVVGTPIPISGGGGFGATAKIVQVSTGEVTDFTILAPGSGWRAGDVVNITAFEGDSGFGASAYVSDVDEDARQHPEFFFLNTDVVGSYMNVAFNAATFSANLIGTVNIAANSTIVVGTTGLGVANTLFVSQLGANVPLTINGNTRFVTYVANNSHIQVDQPYSNSAISNANVVINLPLQSMNINSSMYESLSFTLPYGPCAPVKTIFIVSSGQLYTRAPNANISLTSVVQLENIGNVTSTFASYMKSLGIIGSLNIADGGENYIVTDELVFTTPHTSYGRNAGGYVSAVDANGTITEITIDYPRISGRVAVNTTSNLVIGTGTSFTTELVEGSHITIDQEEREVINIANNTTLTVNSAFSSASSNARCALRKDFIGGIYYDANNLPTVTVTSADGSGANIQVLSVIASGENLVPETDAGAIQKIQITNPGSGYSTNAEADMTQSGDGNANLIPAVISGVFNYPGYYLDSTSFLSSSSKLQNRDYYQQFSYVLRSKIPLHRYATVIKALLHPSGTKNFSEVIMDSTIVQDKELTSSITDGTEIPNWSHSFINGDIPEEATFTRSSNAWFFNANGILTLAEVDEPRFWYDPITLRPEGFLSEDQSTNGIRNNTMIGAKVGTPGTAPTNWTFGGLGGLSSEVVEIDEIDGINYIDVRYYGTTTSTGAYLVIFDGNTTISASPGQSRTTSCFVAVVGGSTANISSIYFDNVEYPAGNDRTGSSFLNNLSSTLVRFSSSIQVTGNTASNVQPRIACNFANNTTIDITLRFGLPQIDSANIGLTSPIKTSGNAVTRSVDLLTIPLSSLTEWDGDVGGILSATYRLHTLKKSGNAVPVNINDGNSSGANSIYLNANYAGTQTRRSFVVVNGVLVGDVGSGITTKQINTRTKQAIGWGENRVFMAYEGVAGDGDSGSLSLPNNLTTLDIGSIRSSHNLNGTIEKIEYYRKEREDDFITEISEL